MTTQKMGWSNTKLGEPVPGRPTHSAAIHQYLVLLWRKNKTLIELSLKARLAIANTPLYCYVF